MEERAEKDSGWGKSNSSSFNYSRLRFSILLWFDPFRASANLRVERVKGWVVCFYLLVRRTMTVWTWLTPFIFASWVSNSSTMPVLSSGNLTWTRRAFSPNAMGSSS